MRFAILVAIAASVLARVCPDFPPPRGVPIKLVASLPGAALNGVAVSPDGRVFVSLPRWNGRDTPGVAVLRPDGSYLPYPGGEWNDWAMGKPTEASFVSVHSIYADHSGNLWVVDEGSPLGAVNKQFSARPKIVQIDLRSNKVVKTYVVSEATAPPGSDLGHVRVDDERLYVSEPGQGSILIIDRQSGEVFRRFAGANIALADRRVLPVVAGTPLLANGKPIIVNLDLLELDQKNLYFMPLFGPTLYVVPIADLVNRSLSEQDLEKKVRVEAVVPPATCLTKDAGGHLFLCSITQMAIVRLDAGHRWRVVSQDPRIYLPNEASFDPKGNLYFPVSRLGGVPDLGMTAPPSIYRTARAP